MGNGVMAHWDKCGSSLEEMRRLCGMRC
jgi:hypothetical protein